MATRPAHGNAASGYPGGSARPEPSRASSSSGAAEHTGSSSGAAEHTGGPRSSVNDDEFLEDCSEAFPPPPLAVPLPVVLPPPPPLRAPVLKPPPHSETGGAPEHAHAPTPWQMLPQPKDLLWPPLSGGGSNFTGSSRGGRSREAVTGGPTCSI